MEIRAPMVGTIIEVLVEPGTAVEADEEILFIESMKMQIPITAPWSGVVQSVSVQVGQVVQEGDLLMVLA
ncbi:MAG: acetyl-CoA carboxylase biotin carboxyl carrier protein subunit [Dehalococcoidia bacterium]